MKTTIDLDRMSTTSTTSSTCARASAAATIRLGLVLSIAAALAAIVLRAVLHLPTPAILAVVIVVGAVLSWRAAGQPADRRGA